MPHRVHDITNLHGNWTDHETALAYLAVPPCADEISCGEGRLAWVPVKEQNKPWFRYESAVLLARK